MQALLTCASTLGRRWLLAAVLALAVAPARAAAPPAETAQTPPLPGPAGPAPALRRPTERLNALRRELTYQDVKAPKDSGLLQRFLWWLQKLLANFSDTKQGRTTWSILLYSLMVGILVFAVLKLLQLDVTRLFGRSARAQALDYETGAENIHALDFGAAIADAEATGNLRLATRLGYLHLLKQLTDQELINWQPNKTNHDYLHELAAARPALHPLFSELTRQFEYVWYGEFPLSAAAYRPLREHQQQLSRAATASR